MNFRFPEPIELKTKLKDILEPVVDEKFYLSDKALACFMSEGTGKYPRRERFLQNINRKNRDIGNAVTTRAGNRATDNFVLEPVCIASRGRGENNEQHLEPRRDGVTNTITTVQKDNYIYVPNRLRKLTPKECWRLMGFDDSDIEKAENAGSSKTQLYHQAGNSIVVNCIQAIMNNMIGETYGKE